MISGILKKTDVENDLDIDYRDDEITYYKDDLYELDNKWLKINKYYIPFFNQKVIKTSSIESAELYELKRSNGKYTFFGLSYGIIFYNLDRNRPNKTHGILIKTSESIFKIGITPDLPNKFYKTLNNILKMKKCNLGIDSESTFLKEKKE